MSATVGRRLLGLAFFLVVGLFVAGSIASYNKVFTPVVKIELHANSVGYALPANADVKLRGMTVGEVRGTRVENGQAISEIALDPSKVDQIPADVTARLLPKTLFGERYIALTTSSTADASGPIRAGDIITEDPRGNALEVGQLFDSVLPLLEAIPPEDLSNTLGALANVLQGRGEQIGETIDRITTIFSEVNTSLPALEDDIRNFAVAARTYADAGPNLVRALDNFRTTGQTIVQQRGAIDTLLATATTTANSSAAFLEANRNSIITIANDSTEALELFAEFSPTFGCMLQNFVPIREEARRILGEGTGLPGVRTTITFVNPRGRYLPNQDEPRLFENRGASCFDNVAQPGQFFPHYPGGSYNDGSYQVPMSNRGPATINYLPNPLGSAMPAADSATSYAGSDMERDTLAVIYARATGQDPQDIPSWATLVGAPALRGAEVSER